MDGSDIAEKALPYAEKIVQPPAKITLLTSVDVPEYPATLFYPAGITTYQINKETVEEQVVPQAKEYLNGIRQSLEDKGFIVQIQNVDR